MAQTNTDLIPGRKKRKRKTRHEVEKGGEKGADAKESNI